MRRQPDPCYLNQNDMLRLHESLSAALYKNKMSPLSSTRMEEKSVIVVLLVTLVG